MRALARILRSRWFSYPLLLIPVAYVFTPEVQNDIEYLADQGKYLLDYTGLVATILFVITLSISPIRAIFPKSKISAALVSQRRPVGVSVFIYALLHVLIYFLLYMGTWDTFFKDWSKPFILSGIVAFLLLLVLAITSNNRMVRFLKSKTWKKLHRVVYLIMFLLIYHQAAQEKTGYEETIKVFSPMLALQVIRIGLVLKRST